MTLLKNNNYQIDGTGTANGTTVTTGNSALPDAPATVQIGSGATQTFSTDFAAQAYELYMVKASTGGTAVQTNQQFTFTATATFAFSFYWRTGSSFSVGPTLGRVLSGGNTNQVCRVAIDTSGHVVIRDSANASPQTSSGTLSTSTMYRFDVYGTVGSSQTVVVNAFSDLNADPGSTPTVTITASAQNFGTVNADTVAIGQIASLANVPTFYWTGVRISNTASPIGPSFINPPDSVASAGLAIGTPANEAVLIDVVTSDSPTGLLLGVPAGETVAISVDVTISDAPLGVALGVGTEAVAVSLLVTDAIPSGTLLGVPVETVAIDTLVSDAATPVEMGVGSEAVVFGVLIGDAPSALLAGSGTEVAAADTIVSDTPTGLVQGSVGEAVSVGVTPSDVSTPVSVGAPTETVLYDSIILDPPSGLLLGVPLDEFAGPAILITDVPTGLALGVGSEGVTFDTVLTDAALGLPLGGTSESVVFASITTDAATAIELGVPLDEAVSGFGMGVVDAPIGLVLGLAVETVSIGTPGDVTVVDGSVSGVVAGGPSETVTYDSSATDAPSAVELGGTAEGVAIDQTAAVDAPTAILAGVTADSVVVGVGVADAPLGLVLGQSDETLVISIVIGDVPTGLVLGSPAETIAVGVTLVDVPVGILAGLAASEAVFGYLVSIPDVAGSIRLAYPDEPLIGLINYVPPPAPDVIAYLNTGRATVWAGSYSVVADVESATVIGHVSPR